MKIQTCLLAVVAGVMVVAVGCGNDPAKPPAGSSSSSSSSSSGTSSSSSNSSSSGEGGAGGTGGAGGAGGGSPAVMPSLGTQIDRMGRPAINTALNKTFEADGMVANMGKDAWNANAAPATWGQYMPEIQKNLAILDSLDANCGNQLLADKSKTDPTRYATLAGMFAEDLLYVNIASTTCSFYLGVEANAIGIMNTDCGGRMLAYDVIDSSYSALAAGALSGVSDGIPFSNAAQGTTFPYLATPY